MEIVIKRHGEELSCEELHDMLRKIVWSYSPNLSEFPEKTLIETPEGTLEIGYCYEKQIAIERWRKVNQIMGMCKRCGLGVS